MLKVGWVVGVIVLVCRVGVAAPDDPVLEQRFRDEVAAVSADAATAYDEGNTLRDAGNLESAVRAYEKAIELAPNVDHPHRRLCGVLVGQDKVAEAIAECGRARDLAPKSAYDKAAMAWVLIARDQPGDREEGYTLVQQAAEALPNSVSVQETLCLVALRVQDIAKLRRCSTQVLSLDPDSAPGNLTAALLAANDGDLDEARMHLDKAKAGGLDPSVYDEIGARLDQAEKDRAIFPAWVTSVAVAGLWFVGAWVAVMVLLLIGGFVLSRITLRTVNRGVLTAARGAGSDSERRLRRIYKAVLLVSGAYFYLSMPVMLILVVVAGLGSIGVMLAAGYIVVKLVLIVGIVVIATIGAIVRSLFVRVDSQPPGNTLDLEKHEKLRGLLEDVARTVGTRPVDVAYITPGTEMAVTERGGVWTSLRGKRTQRSLIMGVGLFEGMTQLQLRSVLAHEYGHFRNEDTAGGGFAIAVRRSLITLIIHLARAGVARPWNPTWWFVRGFHRMYLAISQGASRLQEVLADRWAIQAYGSEAFVAGYRHVVARSVEFDNDVDSTLKEVIESKRALPNLYRYQPEAKRLTAEDLANEIEKELTREPAYYDSHPSSRQRIEWARQLAIPHEPHPDDDAPVWELFEDREELEHAMTGTVLGQIARNHGVEIPRSEPEPVDDAAP